MVNAEYHRNWRKRNYLAVKRINDRYYYANRERILKQKKERRKRK